MEKTAVLTKRKLTGWRGDASLYRCTPPIGRYEFIVASAVSEIGGYDPRPEVLLFASDETGNAKEPIWGSKVRGSLSHVAAFARFGYFISFFSPPSNQRNR